MKMSINYLIIFNKEKQIDKKYKTIQDSKKLLHSYQVARK